MLKLRGKLIFTFLALVMFLVGGIASADQGPYHIYADGYCTDLRLFLTPDDMIYGQDIGCSGSYNYTGAFTSGKIALGYSHYGDQRLWVFDLASKGWTIYTTNGTSLSVFNSGTWSLRVGDSVSGESGDMSEVPSPND